VHNLTESLPVLLPLGGEVKQMAVGLYGRNEFAHSGTGVPRDEAGIEETRDACDYYSGGS
jgi:hypothetical protein